MRRYFFIIAMLFAFQSAEAGAFSIFFLKYPGRYNSWELEKIESFLSEVESHIPPKMRNIIDGVIPVDFINFEEDQRQGFKSLVVPKCGALSAQENGKQSDQELARANLRTNLIEINRLFLNEIFLGPKLSQKFNCRHRNFYRTAMAVLLHEVGHLFDNNDKIKVTSTLAFQSLMGFKEPWLFGKAKSKNTLQTRSANPDEFRDLEEAFAVNLEYFLLDSEFACRRPNINQFYEELFQIKINQKKKCEINYTVEVRDSTSGNSAQFNLNPERLYAVDYLLADSGKELMSFWGHSMFNLVFCAPGIPIDAKCREGSSLQHHVVVSFRANLTDIKLSYLKGLFGGYPSQPFLLSMTSIIREYNRLEKRNLISVPLKMNAQEKINFVGQVLEMYSSYMGEFKFLTNNCATETKDVIKSVVHANSVQDLGYSTPKGLLKDLINIGLVEKDYKTKEYSHFDSVSEKYKDAYEKLNRAADQNKIKTYDLDDFIELSAETRSAWYNKIIKVHGDKKSAILLALQIEQDIKDLEKQSFERSIFNTLLMAIEEPDSFEKKFSKTSKQILERITENIQRSERFSVNSKGYGVFLPQDNTDGEFEQILARNNQRDLVDDISFIRKEAESMYSDLHQEIQNTGKNVDWLIKSVREINAR